MSRQRLITRARLTVVAVAALTVAMDALTKDWARHSLESGARRLWGPVWFRLHFNSGVSFSLGLGSAFTTILVTLVAGALVLGLAWRSRVGASAVAFGLVVGGGAGNIVNRLFTQPHVVTDFVSVGSFPIFNLADSAITVGAVILLVMSAMDRPVLL